MSRSDSATRPATAAVEAFRAGEPVLVYDAGDREAEVDMVVPPRAVDAATVARLRNDAGGLVCVALDDAVAESFDLPFLADALDHPAAATGELGYDDRASFSLPVNHRETHTGVTDADRALTVSALGDAAADPAGTDFADTFRVPGHVHVLRAAPGLLGDRRGHTELGVAMARAADRAPAAVVCEMLDDRTGGARSVADARAYADAHELVFVEGADLVAELA